MIYTPPGTPAWGAAWKKAAAKNYLHSFSISVHGALHEPPRQLPRPRPDLPRQLGRPLLRMTFDFTDNEHKMSDYMRRPRAPRSRGRWARREIKLNRRTGSWSVVPYQTTHNTGGAIMGATRATASSTSTCRAGTCPTCSSLGAGAFPQNAGYNPTGTVAALAYLHAATRSVTRT